MRIGNSSNELLTEVILSCRLMGLVDESRRIESS